MTATFLDLVDLASERLGGAVLAANDEFFAPKENLLKRGRADLDRGQVHRTRQVDGRLGDAPPARRRRSRLVHRPSRRARHRPRRRRRHGVLQGQLSRSRARSTRATRRRWPTADDLVARRVARDPAADAAQGRLAQPDRRRPASHGRRTAPAHLSRRRRRPAARPRRRRRRLGPAATARRRRSRRGRARRPRRRLQRHVLRLAPQPDHARRRDPHGRRLGDEAAARRRDTIGRSSGSATAGTIRRVEVDTRHFKGNAPGACSLEGAVLRAGTRPCRRRSGATPAADGAPAAHEARCSRTTCGRPATSRTCGSTSIPTAASDVCACSGGRGRQSQTGETYFSATLRALRLCLVTCTSTRSTHSTRNPPPARCAAAADRRGGSRRWLRARPFPSARGDDGPRRRRLGVARCRPTGSRRSPRIRASGRSRRPATMSGRPELVEGEPWVDRRAPAGAGSSEARSAAGKSEEQSGARLADADVARAGWPRAIASTRRGSATFSLSARPERRPSRCWRSLEDAAAERSARGIADCGGRAAADHAAAAR